MAGSEVRLDPWGRPEIKDYSRLYELFGIRPLHELLPRLKEMGVEPSIFMRRGIVFGHRDLDKVLEAWRAGEPVAVVTGFMPSGKFHLGHMTLGLQLAYYQRLGFKVFLCIADAEAYAVRKVPRREAVRIGVEEYIANFLALGLDPSKTEFYFQTSRKGPYHELIQLFSSKVSYNEMEAIYGELTPGKVVSALTQVADILHPMLPEYGGYRRVLVPVGADQDPHIRLTRDIAQRMNPEIEHIRPPAATYQKFIRGLDGGKMSSSKPEFTVFLTDPVEEAVRKFRASLTGGRNTAEEQRRLGGEPDKCPVFDQYLYYLLPDDSELASVEARCRSGTLLCGECKRFGSERLAKFLEAHQRSLEHYKDKAWSIVEVPKY
ncbi:MAG: tryptophan--tRNA ligase [Acidilobus sp.]|nr:tryptophan--tRNA ligase [Acidilobus sp.]